MEPDVQHQEIKCGENEVDTGKIVITGDDILIEYVGRLIKTLKVIKDGVINVNWVKSIENFITHQIWHSVNSETSRLWQRLEFRHNEMVERRKKMQKAAGSYKNGQNFEIEFNKEQQKKQVIIQAFSVAQLEEMLKSSTKNVAYDVVSCLIPSSSSGVLYNIVTWLSTLKRTLVSSGHYSMLDQKQGNKEVIEDNEDYITGCKTLNESNIPKEDVARPAYINRSKEKTYLTPIKNSNAMQQNAGISGYDNQGGSNGFAAAKLFHSPKTMYKIEKQKGIIASSKK